MPRAIVVHVGSNGAYWQASWRNEYGERFKRSLGAKSQVSMRKARKLAQQLANQLNNGQVHADPREVPLLKQHLERYIASRTDLRSGSVYLHKLTQRYLTEFFGETLRIDRISRADARNWLDALKAGRFSKEESIAPATARGHLVNAKAMFQRAVDDELAPVNPFDRLSVSVPKPSKNWHYVSPDDLEKLLAACPNVGWKALIALCRLAGLRRGEALHLRWPAVDWDHSRITVTATKTQRHGHPTRIVPMQARLRNVLQEAFGQAVEPCGFVCDINRFCIWRNFTVIRRHAGLDPWDDAFQVMRRNCETDWAQHFPQYVVSEWLGHDIRVSAEFYLSVPEDLYIRASRMESSAPGSSGTKTSEEPSS